MFEYSARCSSGTMNGAPIGFSLSIIISTFPLNPACFIPSISTSLVFISCALMNVDSSIAFIADSSANFRFGFVYLFHMFNRFDAILLTSVIRMETFSLLY